MGFIDYIDTFLLYLLFFSFEFVGSPRYETKAPSFKPGHLGIKIFIQPLSDHLLIITIIYEV
ncbi:hypothetical protein ACFPFV_05760 [Salinicoccus siamensis]|uniref:hypothetical protein n=1 Tax=Salinicoccus siamensis TaxID=381830 RepID=UPI00362231D6